jgi:two-component system, response regulator YesN
VSGITQGPIGGNAVLDVLVVDDEDVVRRGLVKLLWSVHSCVGSIRTADDGLHAIQLMEEKLPDVVMTDIRMPNMDGIELCRTIAEKQWNVQLVVVSGYGDFHYARRCMSYGVKEYLLKPVARDQLRQLLDKLAAYKANLQDPFQLMVEVKEWITQLEQAVWTADDEEICRLLRALEHNSARGWAHGSDKEATLRHCLNWLIRGLNSRNVFVFDERISLSHGNQATLLEQFEAEIRRIVDFILQRRRGDFKNPVEEAMKFMEENLAEEISLEETAQHIGLSPTYFSVLFKRVTGETFIQYRIRLRVEKAKRLLEIPHYRITDISTEVGYVDHPHFTRTFKKHTGILPSEYRRQLWID